MNAKKIIGWVLVAAGLLVIGQAINLSYQFFTGKAEFPAIFKAPSAAQAVAVPVADQNKVAVSAADAQAQMQQAIGQATAQAVNGMIPLGSMEKLLNAIMWSVFATFLVYSGAKISEIGVKLIS